MNARLTITYAALAASLTMAANVAIEMGASAAMASTLSGYGEPQSTEKCYGVVRQGWNDCGTPFHACAGHAAGGSGSKEEWVMVPTGLCDKLVNGAPENILAQEESSQPQEDLKKK